MNAQQDKLETNSAELRRQRAELMRQQFELGETVDGEQVLEGEALAEWNRLQAQIRELTGAIDRGSVQS